MNKQTKNKDKKKEQQQQKKPRNTKQTIEKQPKFWRCQIWINRFANNSFQNHFLMKISLATMNGTMDSG